MAITELIMPKMGESIAEATILRWHKNVGDRVQQEETILEIATDKVDSEVPSTASGVIKEILYNVNDVVAVGAVIARIEVADAIAPVATPSPVVAQTITPVQTETIIAPPPPAAIYQQETVPYIPQTAAKPAASGNNKFFSPLVLNIANSEGLSLSELERIPGTGADGRVSKRDVLQYIADKRAGKVPAFVPAPIPSFNPLPQQPVAPPQVIAEPAAPVYAPVAPTPVVAAPEIAIPQPIYIPPQQETVVQRQAETAVQRIEEPFVGSAPAVVETKPEPVLAETIIPAAPIPVAPTETPKVETVIVSAKQEYIAPPPPIIPTETNKPSVEIIEMDRMRKLIAQHMVQSKATSAHVTSFAEADVTNMVVWRKKIKEDFEQKAGTKITFTPMFIECLTKVMKRYPIINSSVEGDKILIKNFFNIGMATALPDKNLIVPVIKHAEQLGLIGLAKSVNYLADAARNHKLKPDDTQGGTFTFTNVGSFGSLMGTPIINQPQVAILAVGAIKKRPVVIETDKGDYVGIRHMMYLSLSYDHRIIDGSVGASFLTEVAKEFEKWDPNRELKLVVKEQYVD